MGLRVKTLTLTRESPQSISISMRNQGYFSTHLSQPQGLPLQKSISRENKLDFSLRNHNIGSMYRYKICSIAFLALILPLSLFAAEGGFGDGMSRNFYSEIERGHYTLQQQMMDTRLSSYPDLTTFVRSCGVDVTLKPGTKVDATLLRKIDQ